MRKSCEENNVSVIIPFYSGVNWLEEAIESVLEQTQKAKEIIVVNDGSKEDVSSLMLKYEGVVKFVYQNNNGAASARNHGMKISSGDYIAFLDSDDLWLPQKLEMQIKFMKEHELQWSHCPYEIFDDKTRKIVSNVDNNDVKGMVFPKLLARCKIGTPCVMIKRECINDSKFTFNEKMRQGQDYCFWNVLAKKHKLGNVGETLVRVRNHNSNIAKNVFAQLKSRSMMYDYLIEKCDYFGRIPCILSLGFKMCKLGEKMCSNIKNNKVQNKMAYLFYFIPWSLFHLYYKWA